MCSVKMQIQKRCFAKVFLAYVNV